MFPSTWEMNVNSALEEVERLTLLAYQFNSEVLELRVAAAERVATSPALKASMDRVFAPSAPPERTPTQA